VKNGPYELIVAPDGYPGVRYRGRYAYEHVVVWWQNTGAMPPSGSVVHHKDENKRNNEFDNLETKPRANHTKDHKLGNRRVAHSPWSKGLVRCKCKECKLTRATAVNEWRWKNGLRNKRIVR
jgi:hypothetical protein